MLGTRQQGAVTGRKGTKMTVEMMENGRKIATEKTGQKEGIADERMRPPTACGG